eukprot:5588097-Amphidinium_carterae.1
MQAYMGAWLLALSSQPFTHIPCSITSLAFVSAFHNTSVPLGLLQVLHVVLTHADLHLDFGQTGLRDEFLPVQVLGTLQSS